MPRMRPLGDVARPQARVQNFDFAPAAEGQVPAAFASEATERELVDMVSYSELTVGDCMRYRLEPGVGDPVHWTQLPMIRVDRRYRPRGSSTPTELDGEVLR